MLTSLKSMALGGAAALTVLFLAAPPVVASPDALRLDDAAPFDAKTAFAEKCEKCHGPDGKFATKIGDKMRAENKRTPDLTTTTTDPAKFEEIITKGVPDTGMKAFESKFTAEQIKALAEYSKTFKK